MGFTKSLLHFDGIDESTTFTDESGKTWTAHNSAQLDTAQFKFGTASGLFAAATADYISTPGNSDFNLSNGDFTIDFWVRFNSLPGTDTDILILRQYDSSSAKIHIYLYNNSGNLVLSFNFCDSDGFGWEAYTDALSLSINTWYHVAIIRHGSNIQVYLNGTAHGNPYNIGTNGIANRTNNLNLGYSDPAETLDGWLDEFRFSVGIARWTGNFTPPTEAYDSSEVDADNLSDPTTLTGALNLTQQHVLSIAGLSSGDSIPNIDLVPGYVLTLQNLSSISSIDGGIVLTQVHNLSVGAISSGESIGSPSNLVVGIPPSPLISESLLEGGLSLVEEEGRPRFSAILPMIQAAWIAHSDTCEISAELPILTSFFNALAGEVAVFEANLPLLTSLFTAYSEVKAQFSGVLPLFTSRFNTLSGSIATFSGELPLITGLFLELPSNHATFDVTLPLIFSNFYTEVIPITFNRIAIVMHLFSHAITEYKNFNFNSLAHFGGLFLGANEQGILILGGNDDLGEEIQADIRSGIHDFASDGVIKLPKEAWLAYRSDGEMELDIEVEESKSPYSYIFDKAPEKITEERQPLGKGLKQRFYTFIIKNVEGSSFDLESLRILGNVISRKRR